ncbi:hypothetical protein CEXT_456011 [Caerostris extrusa]|uniref:Uncharacterized protein n=1 Tax=Caerostris extrusa TaxID=172846 RepID=A0AAV4YGM5_CAEEX|nr:hypothetical protein CEXT_456011 [Caerostris extrusa]
MVKEKKKVIPTISKLRAKSIPGSTISCCVLGERFPANSYRYLMHRPPVVRGRRGPPIRFGLPHGTAITGPIYELLR